LKLSAQTKGKEKSVVFAPVRKHDKRDWESIVVDILEATVIPEKKMRIMYKANLNYNRFNNYFYDLLDKGFLIKIEDPDGKLRYKCTEKGKTLLATFKKARDLFSSEEKKPPKK
jgi:predicted transcriptional regulator